MLYHIPAKVVKVEEKFEILRTEHNGDQRKRSMGWFILLEGSWEYLHIGYSKPELSPGDRINITIWKPNAQARPTPI